MKVIDKTKKFYKRFKGQKGVIGFSFQGRPIYCFKIKKSSHPVIIVQCAIHAREHITARLCLKLMEDFARFGSSGTVYFLPIVNPDGVNIAERINPLYKANARGVDLNVNFDARWGTGKSNVRVAGAQNYIGDKPFSEPESKALKDFTLMVMPDITVSYHAKGEEIYFEFFQKENFIRDKIIANAVASVMGYKVKGTPFSAGGYKDWCISSLKIPSLTIEVGKDSLKHPLKKGALKDIYKKNKLVLKVLTERIWK